MITKMDSAIEVRRLPPSIVRELTTILDYNDSWKSLMAKIPKKLSCYGFKSDITPDNLAKYNSEDFKIIECGGVQYKKSCTTILFDEWGTSGRPRATLGHLKYLLVKAGLFRAADYVAQLLGEDPPPRPSDGPAASVPINMSEITPPVDADTAEVERHLDEINYVEIAIEKIRTKSLEIKNPSAVIPKIVVSEVKTAPESFQIPLVVPRAQPQILPEILNRKNISNKNISEAKQSNVGEAEFSGVVPELSILLHQEPASNQSEDNSTQNGSIVISSNQTTAETTDTDEASMTSDFIPALSIINQGFPTTDDANSYLIPNFDMLQLSSNSNDGLNIPLSIPQSDSNPTSLNSGSAKCPSPLPNLSLNTQLPHFTYAELEATTNSFSSDKETGRLLGEGAFGSVFLSIGLLDRPVAVKKMFLENVEIVNEDDQVTKQFRNEVELLYKYNHDNLVSLLGYSCDGSTYCLVYEYVPGGSLLEVIQKLPKSLLWEQRIHIALGTAKAVAYLHTAFSTPLIHRDIKSANILLDAKNNAKLCDFGIVKLLPGQTTDLETALCGTSAYMSPEYHRGDISVKLDTFSFGVVLLELLTSLQPVDDNREGADLVTYVENQCEDLIDPLLDKTIGTWRKNGIYFAKELYNLTLQCLEDKNKRLEMVDVVTSLEDMTEKLKN